MIYCPLLNEAVIKMQLMCPFHVDAYITKQKAVLTGLMVIGFFLRIAICDS